MQFKQCKWTFHKRRSKTIYERTANQHIKDKAKGHYKDNPEINSGQVLLTVMQVFGNANGLFP